MPGSPKLYPNHKGFQPIKSQSQAIRAYNPLRSTPSKQSQSALSANPTTRHLFPVPVEHYENFPVASILLPRHLRGPIEAIYAFARSADDFADEGDLPVSERVSSLSQYMAELDKIERASDSDSALFQALGGVIHAHNLPISLFRDLLNAFLQDVTQTGYADFPALMDYCRRSANPIGRLLLHLLKQATPDNLAMSDDICSALQLINHWQDVGIDWQKNGVGRVYLPQEDLRRFGLSNVDIARSAMSENWRQMMVFQTDRARSMMLRGAPLSHRLTGRFGAELRLIVAGGLAILDKIDAVNGDVFRHRPTLSKWDWLRIAPAAIMKLT